MNRKMFLVPLIGLMALLLIGSAPPRVAEKHASVPSDEAIARAVNGWTAIPEGYRLQHPRHTVEFTAQGLRFARSSSSRM